MDGGSSRGAERNAEPFKRDDQMLQTLPVASGPKLANVHGWLGDALIWLAGLHAAAALYHHFWRRDAVLLSMLPGR